MLSLNLAPYNYRKLLDLPNEIVKKITCRKVEERSLRPAGFEALVYLNKKSLGLVGESFALYSRADGGGYHLLDYIAIYKAISEALERWAYMAKVSTDSALYGFDIDSSTSGMASYPDFFKNKVRSYANMEAMERWRLHFWWKGRLSSRVIDLKTSCDFNAVELIDGFFNEKTVVVYSKKKYVSYGFATAENLDFALRRARVEQVRNEIILSDSSKFKDVTSLLEKRMLFFAEEGFLHFEEKIKSTNQLKVKINKPNLIIDKEIIGPWSKYSKVWRCLYSFQNETPNTSEINHFIF